MKYGLRKYWFPLAVILAGTFQSFATEMVRSGRFVPKISELACPDTVIYDNSSIYTKYRTERTAEEDSAEYVEQVRLGARDTIHAPDSLRLTDPFRYKYYVALVDPGIHALVRDSLKAAGDSLIWPKIDSIYYADSARIAREEFELWYSSLDKIAKKKYDFEQKMKLKQHLADSMFAAKDSLKAIRDSIAEEKPRILETYAVPDSMQYKRIITWTVDRNFNQLRQGKVDTSYNYWFNDYRFMRKDINASYLGISGSPVQSYDFSKRKREEAVSFYEPYEAYSYSPATVPMYNTKTPYTELAYWGTLFANVEREEQDVHVLTTQNIYPSLNLTFNYDRTGANGMLESEKVNNRTFFTSLNYLGKRYSAHLGYIFNSVRKAENGGIVDNYWIRDTTVDSREINVHLKDADNVLKKNTVYLNQTYRIPFNFLKKLSKKDTLSSGGDTHADVTTAFIGHNSEYSVYTKHYTDKIGLEDSTARTFYNDRFYLNPTQSSDSLRVMKFENKFFIKLQPWAEDAVVSSVNAGIGNRILNYYMENPLSYLTKSKNTVWNSTYIYGGVAGQIKKYANWDAQGSYTFAGDEMNDFQISANASFSIYPFRRHRNSPITFSGHFETGLKKPEYYQQHYFSNHLKWDNDFAKVSTSEIGGSVEIPHWNFLLNVAYTQLSHNIFYNSEAIACQNDKSMNVLKLSLMKNFKLWNLHFENQALFQSSSRKEVVPVPTLALNLRWYLQFNLVKNVLQMQLGANALYTSKWYAPSYSPETGLFHNQTREKYGNSPYIDAFVNMQWKRACIFVKLVNVNMGPHDYFAADGYIRPQRALKFGVWWPFYMGTKKHNKVSAGGGSGDSSGQNQRPTGGAGNNNGFGGGSNDLLGGGLTGGSRGGGFGGFGGGQRQQGQRRF